MEFNHPKYCDVGRESSNNIVSIRLKRNIEKFGKLRDQIIDSEIEKEKKGVQKCWVQPKSSSTSLNSFRSALYFAGDKKNVFDLLSF